MRRDERHRVSVRRAEVRTGRCSQGDGGGREPGASAGAVSHPWVWVFATVFTRVSVTPKYIAHPQFCLGFLVSGFSIKIVISYPFEKKDAPPLLVPFWDKKAAFYTRVDVVENLCVTVNFSYVPLLCGVSVSAHKQRVSTRTSVLVCFSPQ